MRPSETEIAPYRAAGERFIVRETKARRFRALGHARTMLKDALRQAFHGRWRSARWALATAIGHVANWIDPYQ